MGARHGRWLERVVSRIPLLLMVALVAAVVGAVPGDRAGAAPKSPPGDPPGNNGTVKIERDAPDDPDQGNEPHVDGCIFWVEYYGFDQGQTADITFTAMPPSGDKVLITDKAVPVSDDPAGGGQDRDNVIGYNLASAVEGLEAHPQQGYHIKLTSDSLEAPGGAKQKVFWIKCAPQPPTTLQTSKVVQGAGAGPFGFELNCNHRPLNRTFTLQAGEKLDVASVPPGTVCAVTETNTNGAQSTAIAEDPPHGKADDGQVKAGAGAVTIVTFTNTFPAAAGARTAAATGGAVLGATDTRPEAAATLPRTGTGVVPLAATGLGSLAAGALALLGGRRLRRT